MTNRMISYGYGVANGAIVIVPNEAEIVREIFDAYMKGKILKEIAFELSSRGIVFFGDKCNWNKNTVDRIIRNEKYIGADDYPAIIDTEIFVKANARKESGGHKKKKAPEIIEYLKGVVICGNCGGAYHRRVDWGTREKWYCVNGCKCDKYIDDAFILGGIRNILNGIKKNPESLYSFDCNKPTYRKTQEIIRYTNEIGRLTNERTPSFHAGKKLILECASLKFLSCGYNGNDTSAAYIAEQLAQEQEYLQKDFLQKIIEEIIVNSEGRLSVRLTGGVEIVGNDSDKEGDFENAGEKDDNKDRSESAARKEE